jgi:protein TonB
VLLAVLASLALHAVVAGSMSLVEPPARPQKVWMEMVVVEPPPPPPPIEPELPPPPEPEPPKSKPKEVVKFEDTSPVPPKPTDVPPSNAKKVTRLVQGLSNDSFVQGNASGFSVQAGNTTATAYRPGEKVDPNDTTSAQGVAAYQSVAVAPKIERRVVLQVPEELKAANLTGKVDVELTISGEGRVADVRIVRGLHPAADAACVRDVKLTRWKPGLKDGTPVTVTGVPFTCRYEVLAP